MKCCINNWKVGLVKPLGSYNYTFSFGNEIVLDYIRSVWPCDFTPQIRRLSDIIFSKGSRGKRRDKKSHYALFSFHFIIFTWRCPWFFEYIWRCLDLWFLRCNYLTVSYQGNISLMARDRSDDWHYYSKEE